MDDFKFTPTNVNQALINVPAIEEAPSVARLLERDERIDDDDWRA